MGIKYLKIDTIFKNIINTVSNFIDSVLKAIGLILLIPKTNGHAIADKEGKRYRPCAHRRMLLT